MPYSVPVNFVYLDNAIYFHGTPKSKKMDILAVNNQGYSVPEIAK